MRNHDSILYGLSTSQLYIVDPNYYLSFFQSIQFVLPLVYCPLVLNVSHEFEVQQYFHKYRVVFSGHFTGTSARCHYFLWVSVLSRWHVTAVVSQLILSPSSLRAFSKAFPWTHSIWQNACKKLYAPSELYPSFFPLSLSPITKMPLYLAISSVISFVSQPLFSSPIFTSL